MKKELIILLVLMVVLTGIIHAEELTFRGFPMGATKTEVRQGEDAEFIDEGNGGLVYLDTLSTKQFLILYTFQNNKLVSGMYYFSQDYVSNPNIYVNTYDNIKSNLVDKYGKADNSNRNWINNPTFDDGLGSAVKTGELMINDGWEFDNGELSMTLGNNGEEVLFGIIYEGDNYEDNSQSTGDKL